MTATPAPLRRALYIGGIIYAVCGANTLINAVRASRPAVSLLGCSMLAVGFAVSLLGDRRASVQTPRATLVWTAMIAGSGLALAGAWWLLDGSTGLP